MNHVLCLNVLLFIGVTGNESGLWVTGTC